MNKFTINARNILAFVLILRAVAILVIGNHFGLSALTPSDIGFGFEGYIESLLNHGTYESCKTDFVGSCAHISRLPFIPYLFALSFCLFGSPEFAVVGLSVVASVLFYYALRDSFQKMTIPSQAIICLILLNPLLLKHLATPHYEEFVIGNYLPLWCLYAIFYFRTKETKYLLWMNIVGGLLYLTKETMLPICLYGIVAALIGSSTSRRLASVFGLVAVIGWGAWIQQHGSTRYIGSSWDGENSVKATAPLSMKLFPTISLDRLIDRPTFEVNGILLRNDAAEIGIRPQSSFRNEIEWSDYNTKLAYKLVTENPGFEVAFVLKKAFYALIGVHDQLRDPMGVDRLTFVGVIFAFYRIIFIICIVVAWKFSSPKVRFHATVLFAILAAPYIFGWGQERHITVFMTTCSLAAMVLACENIRWPAWVQRKQMAHT
jgi:hypothetical protein